MTLAILVHTLKTIKESGVLYANYFGDRIQFVSCNYLQIYPIDQSKENVLLIRPDHQQFRGRQRRMNF